MRGRQKGSRGRFRRQVAGASNQPKIWSLSSEAKLPGMAEAQEVITLELVRAASGPHQQEVLLLTKTGELLQKMATIIVEGGAMKHSYKY